MLVSVYLCKNLNRKRAAAGSESAGDAVLPKEKCGASGKECGAKKRLLEKMPQGAGAFRRGCRSCGKTNAPNREGRSLSCRRRKNAARQAKNAGQKNGCLRKCRKVPERFVAGVGVAGKRMRRTKEGGRCSCRRRKNAACQAKNAGQKNGCLRKCRKVPERFVAGVGVAGKRMR